MAELEKDWVTKAGLRAVVLVCTSQGRRTHRCGYVEVPVGHPLHGIDYGQQTDCISRDVADRATIGKKGVITALTATVRSDGDGKVRRSPDIAFDVHGGLTFSGGESDYPIQSDGWWFGFDCAHSGDAKIDPDPRWPNYPGDIVRSLRYVESECESLAQQIVDLVPLPVSS